MIPWNPHSVGEVVKKGSLGKVKFALVKGKRSEPQPKLLGVCLYCQSEMVAKCGRVKVWHWAHKSREKCDPWWENETEWHRSWKNNFPDTWQEVIHIDQETGEKHIADVETSFGLVIEFQHSPMSPKELESREKFYKNMIWIIDGRRGELDYGHFKMGMSSSPIQNDPLAYQVEWWGRSRLMHNWGEATARVYLDFGEEVLWRFIIFNPDKNIAIVGPIDRQSLIDDCLNGTDIRVMVK